MEKRDIMFLLLLVGGAGYAAYDNWDSISTELGLKELDPERLKAIDLAKKGYHFGQGLTNWQHLQSRKDLGEIEISGNPWTAEPMKGAAYQVIVTWDEAGEVIEHGFRVDIAKRHDVFP